MFGPGWACQLNVVMSVMEKKQRGAAVRTSVLVIELEEVALLVQLVGMAVEQGEDGLQLGRRVGIDVHEGRVVGLDHRQGSRVTSLASGGTLSRRGVQRAAILWTDGRRGRATDVEVVGWEGLGFGALVLGVLGTGGGSGRAVRRGGCRRRCPGPCRKLGHERED
jgi:hypothetical protein